MAWLPLESNPEVLTQMASKLGVPDCWQVVDVLGLDDELLFMTPEPVLAVMLLFPVTEKIEKFENCLLEKIKSGNQVIPDDLVYIKQYISNACGTVALIHSIANNLDRIDLADGPLKEYLTSIRGLSPEEGGHLLQQSQISTVHDKVGKEGQTKAPDPSESANYHYVAFIEKNGYLFELDGRKPFPINHGSASKDTLLKDSRDILRKYMASDPENLHFTVLALSAALVE